HHAVYYFNPLRLAGDLPHKTDFDQPLSERTRLPQVHRTSCCITNSWRFFGSLSEYVCAVDEEGICFNLYTSAAVDFTVPGGEHVSIDVETSYPHEGRIRLIVRGERAAGFKLGLRIPKWCDGAQAGLPDGATMAGSAGRYL